MRYGSCCADRLLPMRPCLHRSMLDCVLACCCTTAGGPVISSVTNRSCCWLTMLTGTGSPGAALSTQHQQHPTAQDNCQTASMGPHSSKKPSQSSSFPRHWFSGWVLATTAPKGYQCSTSTALLCVSSPPQCVPMRQATACRVPAFWLSTPAWILMHQQGPVLRLGLGLRRQHLQDGIMGYRSYCQQFWPL